MYVCCDILNELSTTTKGNLVKIDAVQKIETNISSSVQFKISDKANKIFSLLGNFLYSNKELCVCHEIGANCYDAHVDAGISDVPFEITFPNMLDQHLTFRDFGKGLSEQKVYDLLATYGESTKQDTNSMIGGWGIGSKSPASVSNTWNVSSFHGGKKMDFLVYIDEEGIPSVTKIREEQSTETGLQVSIPIKKERYREWQNAITSAFAYYKTKPLMNNIHINWTESFKYTKNEDDYSVFAKDTYQSNVSFVIINQRKYQLDTNKLTNEFQSAEAASLLRFGVVLHFSTGELDVSISRESLQYTKKTIDGVKHKLISIVEKLFKEFSSYIVKTDEKSFKNSVLTAYKEVVGIKSGELRYGSEGKVNLFKKLFIGKFNTNSVKDLLEIKVSDYNVTSTGSIHAIYNGKQRVVNSRTNFWNLYHVDMFKSPGGIWIKTDKFTEVVFVKKDTKNWAARVKDSGSTGILYICHDEDITFFNGPTCKKSSEFESVKKQQQYNKNGKDIKNKVYIVSSDGRHIASAFDPTKKYVTIEVDNHVNNVRNVGVNNGRIIDVFYSHAKENEILVAVKKPNKISGKSVDEWVKELYTDIVDSKAEEIINKSNAASTSSYKTGGIVSFMRQMGDFKTSKNSTWNTLIEYIKECSGSETKYSKSTIDSVKKILSIGTNGVQSNPESEKLTTLIDALYTRYELIESIEGHKLVTNKHKIFKYVKLVEGDA